MNKVNLEPITAKYIYCIACAKMLQKLLETSSNELVFYCILINSILISTPLYTDSDIMMASVTQQLMNKSAGDWNGAHFTEYKYNGNKNSSFPVAETQFSTFDPNFMSL